MITEDDLQKSYRRQLITKIKKILPVVNHGRNKHRKEKKKRELEKDVCLKSMLTLWNISYKIFSVTWITSEPWSIVVSTIIKV